MGNTRAYISDCSYRCILSIRISGSAKYVIIMSDPLKDLSAEQMRDAFLSLKQGEALERITKPKEHYEGLGLGFFGPETVVALAAVDLIEEVINKLAYNPTVTIHKRDKEGKIISSEKVDVAMIPAFKGTLNSLHIFTETVGVASGSRKAIRLEKALETIGSLGQYNPASRANGEGEEEEVSEE